MRCCTNIIKSIFSVASLLCCACLAPSAGAEGIEINKVEARLTEEGYRLTADFKIVLPTIVEEALKRGVTLYFVSELSVHRSRWYWLDTDIERFEQTTKLSYNTLTRQYRLSRGGLFQSFFELKDALRSVGYQTSPAIPADLLDNSGGGYLARLAKKNSQIGATASMRLDLKQLPKPLQVNALTSDQWSVESKLYHWDINAEAPGSEDTR